MRKFRTEQEFRIAVMDIEEEIEERLYDEDPDWEDTWFCDDINDVRTAVYKANGWERDPRPVRPRAGIDFIVREPDEEYLEAHARDPFIGENTLAMWRAGMKESDFM